MASQVLGCAASTAQEAARVVQGRFCVLVNSSDRGSDVFEIVFKNSEKMWLSCDWPRYAGFTTAHPDLYGFKALTAKGASGWRAELGAQLDGLPAEIDYVLRLEEDFLCLSPIAGEKLNAIAMLMVREDLSYVNLHPVRRNHVGRIIEFFRRKLSKRPLRPLSFSEPYYSSLTPAIWKRSYLRELLRQPGNIWDFEHIVTDRRHYAVWAPVLDYDAIVTKGKWNSRARQQLAQRGVDLNSPREFQTRESRMRGLRQNITFELVGYLSFRIRRRLNKLPQVPRELTKDQFDAARDARPQ